MSMQYRVAPENAAQENPTTTSNAAEEQTIKAQIEAILKEKDAKNETKETSKAEEINKTNEAKEISKAEKIEILCNEHIKNKNGTQEVKAAFQSITQEKADAWAELLTDDRDTDKEESIWESIKSVFKPFYSHGEEGDKDDGKEPHKYFFLAALGFFVILAYTILRVSKDALIISIGGAEMLPVLKLLGVLPAAFLVSGLWTAAVDKLGNETAPLAALAIFCGFFLVFVAAMPHLNLIHSFSFAASFMPAGISKMLQFWMYSLFYIASEMWAVVMIEGVTKSLQNQILNKEQQKRMISSAAMFQSFGLIAAGYITTSVFGIASLSLNAQIRILIFAFVACAIIIGALYKFANPDETKGTVVKDTEKNTTDESINAIAKDLKEIGAACHSINDSNKKLIFNAEDITINYNMNTEIKDHVHLQSKICFAAGDDSYWGPIRSIFRYSTLRSVASVIMTYNISVVIFEVIWKNQVKIFCNSQAALTYGQFMGAFNMWTGIATIALCIMGPVISRIPPRIRNQITPVILLSLSIVFFGLLIAPTFMANLCPYLFATSLENHLAQIAYCGLILNTTVKSTKYCTVDFGISELWGSTAKAIMDGFQSRINTTFGKYGKATGSLIILGLIAATGSIANATLIIPAVLALTIITWITSANGMSAHVEANTAKPVSANSLRLKEADIDLKNEAELAQDPAPSFLSSVSKFFGLGNN